MPRRLTPFRSACAACGDTLLTLACWVLWLALGLALIVQIGIALSNELAVPKFVLRSFEERLQASNLYPRFGRATFDPGGGVLLENVSLSLPEYDEPVVDLRAVYLELDPWLLLAGRFEAQRVHATGATLYIPGMLSPTGRSEEMLHEVDLVVSRNDDELIVEQLVASAAGALVTAHGTMQLQRPPTAAPVSAIPLLENLARDYPAFCRQLVRAAEQLARVEDPRLHAELTPSPTRAANVALTLTARSATLPEFHHLSAMELRASTSFPLLGNAPSNVRLVLSSAEVRAAGAVAHDVIAGVLGTLTLAPFSYTPRDAEIVVADAAAEGFTLRTIFAQFDPGVLPQLSGRFAADLAGSLIAIEGAANLSEKFAALHVAGALSPSLLEPIGARLGRDLRPFINFGAPVGLDVVTTFAPGWKFQRVSGRIKAQQIDAYHVRLDYARGEIDFDGRRFVAHNAFARLGDNFARGRFEQDLDTLEFRFLLEGQLRPLAISGWFSDWWPNFFDHFEFPERAPTASVDVAGRWRFGHETTVFVFAESAGPLIRGAKLDYARTRIFTRPNFIDGLELFGTRGAGTISGTFTRHVDWAARQWREMEIALDSTLDLETGAMLLGPDLGARLAPFAFAQPPHVRATTHFDGPAAPNGSHQSMRIEGQSTGEFSFHGFPARNLSFEADVRDSELTLKRVELSVAGGALSGNGRLWGPDDKRRLGFDAALTGATLGEAIEVVSNYVAQRRGAPPRQAEDFVAGRHKVRLDLAASAEGSPTDLLSYHGNGNVALEGAELGEIHLLGLLSALLDFTSLRFSAARGEFQIDGPRLVFPAFNVTGANSAIHAHGDYRLDRGELDFNARVYPFQESKSLLSVVGAVLTPLSTMLEVKLTGPLDKPKWAFVIGPTNFFRSLNQSSDTAPATPLAPEMAPSAPPPPLQEPQTAPATEKTH